jgi:hypothetical protein
LEKIANGRIAIAYRAGMVDRRAVGLAAAGVVFAEPR